MQTFQKELLIGVFEANKENKSGPKLTGEKDLYISKKVLEVKIRTDNPVYLEVIEMEHNIFERQGLINGSFDCDSREIMFKIPDWDMFITAVHAFYRVCWCEQEDED